MRATISRRSWHEPVSTLTRFGPPLVSSGNAFPHLCYHMEEPFPATSMFSQYLVMRLAKEHDVTVLLDGQGADELLAGYHGYFRVWYGDLLRSFRWLDFRREYIHFQTLRDGVQPLTWKRILAAFLPDASNRWLDRYRKPPMSNWCAHDWLNAHKHVCPSVSGQQWDDQLTERLYFDALCGPLQELLRYGDRNSMSWSRELRQPFLDHRPGRACVLITF